MNAYLSNPALEDMSAPRIEGISVLIAEDTPMGCQLLKDGLQRLRLGLGKIGCAVTVSEVACLCRLRQVDVALISEDLQDGTHKGLEAVEFLRKDRPNVRSVLLVRKICRELTLEAFRSGAKGVFCRMEAIETLGKCILAVHKGQVWADSEQLEVILQALVDVKPMRVKNLPGSFMLTDREEQIASLVADGLTNRQVAKRLGLSEHTVSNYLFRIYEKLGISSRVQFVLYIFNIRQQNQANVAPTTGRTAESKDAGF
jgi:DNA-binding NarL/FixJ family response regulator